jgi:hypothetical protein
MVINGHDRPPIFSVAKLSTRWCCTTCIAGTASKVSS